MQREPAELEGRIRILDIGDHVSAGEEHGRFAGNQEGSDLAVGGGHETLFHIAVQIDVRILLEAFGHKVFRPLALAGVEVLDEIGVDLGHIVDVPLHPGEANVPDISRADDHGRHFAVCLDRFAQIQEFLVGLGLFKTLFGEIGFVVEESQRCVGLGGNAVILAIVIRGIVNQSDQFRIHFGDLAGAGPHGHIAGFHQIREFTDSVQALETFGEGRGSGRHVGDLDHGIFFFKSGDQGFHNFVELYVAVAAEESQFHIFAGNIFLSQHGHGRQQHQHRHQQSKQLFHSWVPPFHSRRSSGLLILL